MATHMVDAAAAGADGSEFAIEHEVIVEAGKFQTILIAASAGVVDRKVAEHDVVGSIWVRKLSAVVAVDAISFCAGDFEVFENEILRARNVNAGGFAAEDWARFIGNAADPDRSFGCSSDVLDVSAGGIGAWQKTDRIAGTKILGG